MSQLTEKLTEMGTKLLGELEEKPLKSILFTVAIVWLITKVVKNASK